MKKPKLIIGTINSQPLGTKHERFEEQYQNSYKPFLKLLHANPDIHAVLYYSGILLEQLEEHHPEFIMLLQELNRRKQVEMLGGAYYEPFLPLIPNTDKLGQIEFLTTYLRKRFGSRMRGCWVPYGVWDHILPFTLKNSGMEFAFLNTGDGETGKDALVPSITEEYGKSLVVYPIFSRFLGKVTVLSPTVFLQDILKETEGSPDCVVSLLGRGDQIFTDKISLQEKQEWFQDFFAVVRDKRDKVEFTLPGIRGKSDGLVRKKYFPPTTYGELIEWKGRPFSEDKGVFKKSLLEFPEANVLYSKMMYVYQLVNQIRGDRSRKKTAREELWKGQGNSVFWHARDGGVYRNSYRKAAFAALLEAEKLTRERGIFKSSIVACDIDLDGDEEYLYQGNTINAYVTCRGAQLFELDYLPGSWNYLDTLAERNKDGLPVPYLRRGFVDHFMSKETTLEQFQKAAFEEKLKGSDLAYPLNNFDREHLKLEFDFPGTINGGGQGSAMNKQYIFKRSSLTVQYRVLPGMEIDEDKPVFASEINLALPEPPGNLVKIYAVIKGQRKEISPEPQECKLVSEVIIEDSINRVAFSLSGGKRFRLWTFPIYTNCMTEQGELKEYQSTCFVPAWMGSFVTGKPWEVFLTLRADKLLKQT
ncbi:MAG: DUF1926 domain-containing protein [Spirochaetales bacterium]|nr:DUF1926 domain-containing protein [Spirochaetales bacterium]